MQISTVPRGINRVMHGGLKTTVSKAISRKGHYEGEEESHTRECPGRKFL